MFWKTTPSLRERILKKALKEIERLLVELELEGKDLTQVRLKYFKKTHYQTCSCAKCISANHQGKPELKGLREMGFKVFFHSDETEK